MYITYLPHEAVAEVSNHKEPIGRGCVEFNWFESRLVSDSNDLRFKWFWMVLVVNWFGIQMIYLSIDLRFNGFACQLMWDSNGSCCQLIRDSMDSVVKWFEIHMIWLSNDFGCQLVWNARDLLVNWCNDLCCQVIRDSKDLCSQLIWDSKTKLFCETSFKTEALKLKNQAFVRNFLQKWSFQDQKRSIFTRLPSKMTCWPDTWPQNSNTF